MESDNIRPDRPDTSASREASEALLSCTLDESNSNDCQKQAAPQKDAGAGNSNIADKQPATPQDTAEAKSSPPPLELTGLEIVEPVKAGETNHVKIKIDDDDRDVYLHLPAKADPGKPMPLVIVYNGVHNPGGAGGMEKMTEFGKKADELGFVVAYPQGGGMGGSWNNGQMPFDWQDDVKFTSKLMDTLQANLNIDKERIYLVGLSWGGSMMHRALSQLSDRVAAGVDVAGFMTEKEKWKVPDDHVSQLTIHSKDDDTVYYNGRTSFGHKLTGFYQAPVPNTFDFYRRQNSIKEEPAVTETKGPDGNAITTRSVVNPEDGTEVKLITIGGIKHGWPGSYEIPNSMRATDEVVDFLMRHKLHH